MSTRRRHFLAALPMTAAVALGSLVGAGTALATGTCPGNKTEVVIPAEQRDVSPLAAYDLNGDWIVCQSVKGKKTTYSDNRI
jgi:hypothetical protein